MPHPEVSLDSSEPAASLSEKLFNYLIFKNFITSNQNFQTIFQFLKNSCNLFSKTQKFPCLVKNVNFL